MVHVQVVLDVTMVHSVKDVKKVGLEQLVMFVIQHTTDLIVVELVIHIALEMVSVVLVSQALVLVNPVKLDMVVSNVILALIRTFGDLTVLETTRKHV